MQALAWVFLEENSLSVETAQPMINSLECDFGLLIEKMIRQDFLRRNTRTGEISFAFQAVKVWRSNRGGAAA